MTTAQRWTTLFSRTITGFAVSLMIHSTIDNHLGLQLLLQVLTIAGLLLLLFKAEYNPIDNSKEEKIKKQKAEWEQVLILFIGLAVFSGGLTLWLT